MKVFSFSFVDVFILFYVYECFLSVCIPVHFHALCLVRSEEGIRFPGSGAVDGCEPL